MASPFLTLRMLLGPRRSTPTQRRSLLRLIAASAENRVDLAPLLRAWSQEEWGWQALRLRWLAKTLDQGVALPNALERRPTTLGDEDTLLVRHACESGVLAPAIRARLESEPTGAVRPDQIVRRTLTYGLAVVLFSIPAMVYLQYIFPSLRDISQEFFIDSTSITKLAARVSLAPIALLCAIVVLGLVFELFRGLAWPYRFLRRVVGPWLFRSWRTRRKAGVLDRLSDSVGAGRPILGAVSTLARYHYDPSLRHRLLVVRNECELGTPLWDAMQSAGLLTAGEATALASADVTDTRAWSLATLGEASRRKADRRQRAEANLLLPLLLLCIGAFVLLQALGVFAAITQLIVNLT